MRTALPTLRTISPALLLRKLYFFIWILVPQLAILMAVPEEMLEIESR